MRSRTDKALICVLLYVIMLVSALFFIMNVLFYSFFHTTEYMASLTIFSGVLMVFTMGLYIYQNGRVEKEAKKPEGPK